MRYFASIVGLALAICATPAFAFDCRSPVVDEGHVITDSSVATAAAALSKTGADVHVVTLESLPPGKKMSQAIDEMLAQCPSWQSTSGKYLKSDMLVIGYAKPDLFAVNYGVDFQPKLGSGVFREVARPIIVPAMAKFAHGDTTAMTVGLSNLLNAYLGTLSRPGGATGPVTIHQATDLKGLWWVLAGVLLLVGGFLAWTSFSKNTDKEDERKAAQAEAEAARQRLVSGLNQVTDTSQIAVYEAMASSNPDIAELVRRYKSLGSEGNALLARHDDSAGASPMRERLTTEVYQKKTKFYEDAIQDYVEPARDLARQIENGKPDPVAERPARRAATSSSEGVGSRVDGTFVTGSSGRSYPPQYSSSPNYGAGSSPVPPAAQPYVPPPQPQTVVVQQGDSFTDAMLGTMIAEDIVRGSERSRDYDLDRRERDLDRREDRLDRREDRDDSWSRPEPVSRSSSSDDYRRDDNGGDISVDTNDTWKDSGGDVDFGGSSDSGSYDSGSDL